MDRFYRIKTRKEISKIWLCLSGQIEVNGLLPFLITLCFLTTGLQLFGQSTGDYRSRANGNWSSVSTWQYYNGGSWVNATTGHGYPGQNATGASVQVRDNVTLNVSPPRSVGSLTIDGNQSLNSSGNPDLTITGNVILITAWAWIIPFPSSVSFGNGNLSIGGNLTLEPGCSFTFGTGNLTSSGTIFLDNAIGIVPATFQNNGNVTLSNTGAGTLGGEGEWTQGTNSTLNYAGSTLTVGTLNASATGNLVNYYRNGAQTIASTSSNIYHHLMLQGTGTKTSSNNLNIDGDLAIDGAAQLDVDTGNDNINLAGDWNVTSSNGDPFLQGTESVTLDGTSVQVISPGSGGETFYNLRINNSFGASPQVTINGNLTVTNVLTMDDGNVNLNGYTFSLTNTTSGALVHGLSSADGWMYGGSFARARPASTTIAAGSAHSFFPLGSSSDWRPFFAGQNSSAATAGTFTVTHTNSTSTSDVNFPESIVRRHNSYWTPRTTASGGTYSLSAGGFNFGTIETASDLRMSTSTGVTGTHAAGSGGPDWRVNRTGVSRTNLNSNNFHLASTDKDNSPLPIELLSFSAQLKNNFVELKWSTASETNNDFFTIERSTNVEHFEPILTHDGSGTTKEMKEYNIIDSSPLYGRSYYRLKQTDFDGQYTYSAVRVIDYDGPEHATLSAFPNPSSGKNLSIRIEGLRDATHVPVTIMNMQGQKVYEKTIEVKTPGVITEEIFQEKVLPSGLYIIKAGNTLYLEQKIVIE